MAATAVGWCPREEALEVQEVEMKAFPSFRWGYQSSMGISIQLGYPHD